MSVKAKKHLGQHFLTDQNIAKKIADSLSGENYDDVLEIGPGMGILTKYLLEKDYTTHVIEIDTESVEYLKVHYLNLSDRIISKDFLKLNLDDFFGKKQLAIIGNFPYNISSQIVFKTLENKHRVPEFSGMFQKEVAKRIAEGPGYVEYLFTVPPSVVNPHPKVDSGVIRLIRKENYTLPVDEKLFFKVVKTAFNQRRKMLRSSLKSLNLSDKLREDAIFAQRPEQLSVQEFISLTQKIAKDAF
jgi:16S rRNA (adenine1518-N6/adenine1519-N6)-dimethyltransferase